MVVEQVEPEVSSPEAPVESAASTGKVLRWVLPLARLYAIGATMATSFVLVVITAAQAILLARTLGPEARGEYAAVMTYSRLLLYIGLLGTNYAIIRRAAIDEKNLSGISRAALRVGALTGVGTWLVVVVLSFVALPPDKRQFVWLSILCGLTLPWDHMRLNLNSVDQGGGRFGRFNATRLFATAVFPMLLLAAWVMDAISVTSVTVLMIPAAMLALGFRMALREKNPGGPVHQPAVRSLLGEGLPYALSVLVCDLFSRLDSLLILWIAALVRQGLYAAALPAVQILSVGAEALAVFSFNAGAKSGHTCSLRKFASVAAGVFAFQLVTTLAMAFVLGRLIVLVYGEAFSGAIAFGLALLPGQLFQGCTIVADGYLRGQNRPEVGIHSRLFGALIMVAAAVGLFPLYNDMAVPLAASAGNAATAMWIGWVLLRDARSQGTESP
jgi:O-antigen/teichoic acid export membrane protein